ncbi:hypothetical protein KY289_008743 [Solanum tuberosum]|nr:hypothetical protein KY289_008743 [Solanum tuberosum]
MEEILANKEACRLRKEVPDRFQVFDIKVIVIKSNAYFNSTIFEASIEVLEQGSKRRKLWFSSQSLSFAKNFVLPGSAGGCLHSIDCECDIRIGSDTSLGGEGLSCDETEIIWPHDFHILDDPQIHQTRKMTISKNSIKRSRTIKKEIED